MSDFEIAALALGPGVLGLAPCPAGARALAAVARWRPALVISLTEAHEADLRPLAVMLDEAGAGWLHLPVADYGVPADAGAWRAALGRAGALLAGGGRVLVHCRGGCGRSGMLALALMVAAGEEGQAALSRLRAVRPCAVETAAQLAWALGEGG